MRYTVESPSPVPCPTGFVVKNGSKTRARVSSSMPAPSSTTSSTTSFSSLRVVIVSVP